MGAITVEWLMDLESRMRRIQENAYTTLLAKMWWGNVAQVVPTKSRREIVNWLLDSATIEYEEEGNIEFEGLVMRSAEYEVRNAAKGFKATRNQFEDLDGNGVELAAAWVRQIGQYAAYFPQKQVAAALRNGHLSSSVGYDGVPFFSTSHPVHPFADNGTYSNLYTTEVKLDDRHTLKTAFESLAAIQAKLATVPMPNGEDPRNLRALGFIAPPRMIPRLSQLSAANFIGDNGSTDYAAYVKSLSFGPPVEAPELGAAFGGSDTDCYLMVEDLGSQDLGGLIYLEREPFAVNYYTGQGGGATGLDAILNRARELEWHVQGRNAVRYGHPFKLIKLVGQAAG